MKRRPDHNGFVFDHGGVDGDEAPDQWRGDARQKKPTAKNLEHDH